jgi:EAL domain-containing protein (putative c-di-GMP-specific phosphodiesterase class I)
VGSNRSSDQFLQVGAMRRLRAGQPIVQPEENFGPLRSVDQFLHAMTRSVESTSDSGQHLLVLRILHRALPHADGTTGTAKLQLHPQLWRRLTDISGSLVAVAISEQETLAFVPHLDRPDDAELTVKQTSAALEPPVEIDGVPYLLSHRIGAAVLDEENETVDRLLEASKLAVDETDPTRAFMLFHPHQRVREERAASLRRDLRLAILEGELDVALQPAVDLERGEVTGLEAFVRWDRKGRGPVATRDILEAAQSLGLTHQLNHQLMQRAFSTAHALAEQGLLDDITVWMNVTPDEILHPEFASTAAKAASASPHLRLGLKVRPSPSADDLAVVSALRTLVAHGARAGIGDYGVGFSDFAGVHRLPFDTVMLDRTLIRQSTTSTQAASVLKLLVSAALRLELDVIGQGVETEQQLRLLHYTGCRQVQGYLVQKPRSREQLWSYLADFEPLPVIAELD